MPISTTTRSPDDWRPQSSHHSAASGRPIRPSGFWRSEAAPRFLLIVMIICPHAAHHLAPPRDRAFPRPLGVTLGAPPNGQDLLDPPALLIAQRLDHRPSADGRV